MFEKEPRLIVLINAFNEAKHIAKAIESVHEVADEIHVFDGAYREYPHSEVYSTDGTLAIAENYPKVTVHRCEEAWENQLVKRSAMFAVGKPGDYFLKLDGDEYITNPEIIRSSLNDKPDVAWVWTLANLYGRPIMTARIFRYQDGLHYAGRHHWLYNGSNVFVTSDQHMNPRFKHRDTPIRLFNFRDSSSLKRGSDKKGFLANRWVYESLYDREDQVYGKCCRLVPHVNRAGRPYERKAMVLRELPDPDYTFTLMFSRPWAIKRYFQMLKHLRLPKNIEAVVLVDSCNPAMERAIASRFNADSRFGGVKIIYTGNPRLPEMANVTRRRQRIISNWHFLMTEARGKIILGSEDDSLPHKDAYIKLIKTLEGRGADFVQGNIVGRWGARICPAWRIREENGEPVAVWNLPEKRDGIDEVHGVGWYCFAANADVIRKYQMYVDNFLPLGPDVRFGYLLWKGGFKLLHRWDVKVEHFGENFRLYPGLDRTEQMIWEKIDGRWKARKLEDG